MRNPRILLWATLLCASAFVHAADAPATAPASAPAVARPDPNLWAKRNIDLFRQLAEQRDQPPEQFGLANALSFSVPFNWMLTTDENAAQVLAIADAAIAREPNEQNKARLNEAVAILRLPNPERQMRTLIRSPDLSRPVSQQLMFNLVSAIRKAPNAQVYDSISRKYVEEMDAAARTAGKWQGLTLAYYRLAGDAQRRGRADLVKLYTDRMLELLREHPEFQDPYRGNADGVFPSAVAAMLLELDRRADLDDLITRAAQPVQIDLLVGMVDALVDRGEVQDARRIIDERLKPIAPEASQRLLASLDGQVVDLPDQAPPAPIQQPGERRRPRRVDPAELRLRSALASIADHHARQGDVALAAKQLIVLQRDKAYQPAGPDELPSHTWARLARLAHAGAHDDASRQAFERALAVLSKDLIGREGFDERAQFVREAIGVGDFELANDLLQTTSPPGAWSRHRLALDYLKNGDADRAHALWDQALELAKERGGGTMAEVAVELYRLGQRERAEKLLLDAIDSIDGTDFGFSGAYAVVKAAMTMNRLDLLDTVYQRSEAPERMLLCIVASNIGCADQGDDEGE
jgi:tetratricopeptide (TPR) repeat protein